MKDFLKLVREYRLYIYKIALFLLAVITLVIIFPKQGKFKYEFQKGRPWMHKDLMASHDFAILKPQEEIDLEKERILSQVKPYFIFDVDIVNEKSNELISRFENSWNTRYSNDLTYKNSKDRNWEVCHSLFISIAETGIIESFPEAEKIKPEDQLILINGNEAKTIFLSDLFTIQKAHEFLKEELSGKQNLDTLLLLSTLENSLFRNVKFDADKTNTERELALKNISLARGMVQSGERIISKGELVIGEKYMILESMRQEYESQLGSKTSYYMILAGLIILISISIIVLFFFLMYFRRDIFNSNKKIALILLLVTMMVFITSLVIKYNVGYLYMVPICIIPIIIRAFFDTRPALYVHIITIIIIGFLVPNSFEFVFSQLISG